VTHIVSRLIEDGLLIELDEEVAETSTGSGRRPTLLQFNYDAALVIGVDVGAARAVGVAADLEGTILCCRKAPLRQGDRPREAVTPILDLIEELLESSDVSAERVRGIGIGVPSFVRGPEHVVAWAPALGWRDLPLRNLVAERFDSPVFVKNDADVAALGEVTFGAAQGAEDIVMILIGVGLGAGLFLKGGLYQGHHGAAGEIGYFLPSIDGLGETRDSFGCLESFAGELGIVERAKAALGNEGTSQLRDARFLTARRVFECACNGDPLAVRIVQETADHLAQAIANVIALLDPERVVIGSRVGIAPDLLLPMIKERVAGVTPVTSDIIPSALGEEVVVKGAVALAIAATRGEIFVRETKALVGAD
jgi:predicted NBD/HSP70 family sugar kinase